MEVDGVASVTESYLSVLSILPGETKIVELIFGVANSAKKLQLIVKEDNAQTIIPFVIYK